MCPLRPHNRKQRPQTSAGQNHGARSVGPRRPPPKPHTVKEKAVIHVPAEQWTDETPERLMEKLKSAAADQATAALIEKGASGCQPC